MTIPAAAFVPLLAVLVLLVVSVAIYRTPRRTRRAAQLRAPSAARTTRPMPLDEWAARPTEPDCD